MRSIFDLPRKRIAIFLSIIALTQLPADELPITDPVLTKALQEAGPPLRDQAGVLFRFQPPNDTDEVYLAGSFNNWANNDDGVINNPRFAMRRADSGIRYAFIDTPAPEFEYQFVLKANDGSMTWQADPFVDERHGSNSVVRLTELESLNPRSTSRESAPTQMLSLSLERVWVEPSAANQLNATVQTNASDPQLRINILTPLGKSFYTDAQTASNGLNQVQLPPVARTGGYLVQVELMQGSNKLATESVVLSVTDNPADDLRYGFFASYPNAPQDYDAKAAMLAELYVNAVELYDYFPAHGDYAPSQPQYAFEPFGVSINGLDVREKIEACQRRGILALAYISAYAASESVYQKISDPMTDSQGHPKIFNGGIMTEAEADEQGKDKWFWLMNVSEGSEWRSYIMQELRRTLEKNDEDLVAFDGFEIDTYGDPADARFYANGSPHDGESLADILQGFVADVVTMTHSVKPHGLVSFNSVNEFGVQNMYDVTDFLFLEIWRWQAPQLSELVDICFFHRGASDQRVILKLYPADMATPRKSWPEWTLARILGATMTGGGSLMVAGEPDEAAGTMHALNSLYYPDHQPLSRENADVLLRYYKHDALLYEYTHGGSVKNLDLRVALPSGITRAFHAPKRKAICVQLLNIGDQPNWSEPVASISTRKDQRLNVPLPDSLKPTAVFYASPDSPEYELPTQLDFTENGNGSITVLVPELVVHGSLIVTYE